MMDWAEGEIRWIAVEMIGERYRRYRLPDAAAEAAMAGSLARYGQISPLAVCLREERPEVLDGFKRVGAVRLLSGISSLEARLVEVDEATAKAMILGLNGIGGRMKELEEAWVVQALVREDGLSQLQVAELLGRHKSWVCRRLALLERLSEECREDLRVGLLSPTMARQLTRLSVCCRRAEKAGRSGIHALQGLRPCCRRHGETLRPLRPGFRPQPVTGSPLPRRSHPCRRPTARTSATFGPPSEQVTSLRCWYGSRTRDSQILGLVLYPLS